MEECQRKRERERRQTSQEGQKRHEENTRQGQEKEEQ
jgi:hypothetical protein